MGKMTKNGLNGGKREDYKKKRSQLSISRNFDQKNVFPPNIENLSSFNLF